MRDLLNSLQDRKNWWFYLLILALVCHRFLHFGSAIDGPHTWRQCDTANYILDLYNNGFDLLNPAVCWMGGHGTLILEFPLPEAIAAIFYKVFGPDHVWARLVFFSFFLGAVAYFYKIVKHLFNQQLAQAATIVYLAMPLSLFYSRAVHIDFTAMFFAHGMLWYYLVGIEHERLKSLVIGTAFATLAFLIKVPYAFFFALPLLWWTAQKKQWKFLLRSSWLFAIPIAGLVWWVWHTKTVNAQAPDWDFIPGYHKFTEMWYWYFGVLEQRFDPEIWKTLWERFLGEITGISGLVLLALGMISGRRIKHYGFAILWLVGAIIYLLIFFNLNRVHDYYQLPFLAPVAIFIGMAVHSLFDQIKGKSAIAASGLLIVLLAGFSAEQIYYAEGNYYVVKTDQIAIGEAIQQNTPDDALVVVSYGGLHAHFPGILYRARRYGWSISKDHISPELIHKLHLEGATHLAIVRHNKYEGDMGIFTDSQQELFANPIDDNGLHVYLYKLNFQE